MAIYLSPEQGLTELMNALDGRLGKFTNRVKLHPDWVRIDTAYQIPFRGTPVVDSAAPIPVNPVTGADAVELVLDALTATRLASGQAARETLRSPGVVAMSAELIAELAEINEIKVEIERLISTIPVQRQRNTLWKNHKRSALQTMRQVWITSEPRTVRFYWDTAPSIKAMPAVELIAQYEKLLKETVGSVPTRHTIEPGDPSLKFVIAIEALSGLPPTERVAVCRDGKPHIRARVSYGDARDAEIRPCPTPIIYNLDDPVPSITPLLNWEPASRTPGTANKRNRIEETPIEPGLDIFRYKEKYRWYED